MNKSSDLLAGFDLFYVLSITQAITRSLAVPGDIFLVPLVSNRELCLAGVTEGTYEI